MKRKLDPKTFVPEPFKIVPALDKVGIGSQVMNIRHRITGVAVDKRYVQYLVVWQGRGTNQKRRG